MSKVRVALRGFFVGVAGLLIAGGILQSLKRRGTWGIPVRVASAAAASPASAVSLTPAKDSRSTDAEISACLEEIRQKYQLPALGAAIVTSQGVVAIGVTGVRK